MPKIPFKLKAFLCSIVIILGLFEFLYTKNVLLVYISGIASFLAFLAIFSSATVLTRMVSLLLCGSGLLALLFSGKLSFGPVIEGFAEMTSLVALMAAITLLRIPLELGCYADLFQRFFFGIRRPYQPYLVSLAISYFLSIFSSLGSIAPSYYLIEQNTKKLGLENNGRFETTSIARGFAMAVIISPVSVTVGIALNYSGLSWAGIAVPVFVLSLLGLVSAFFLEPSWRNSGKKQLLSPANYETEPSAIPLKSYLPFLLLFAGVVSPILFLENILHFSSLNSISLGCLFATFAWGIVSGRSSQVFSRSMVFFSNDVRNLFDQILLFISAGFITHTMEQSGGLELLGSLIKGAAGRIGPLIILAMVPVIIALLSIAGFHPFASGIIMAKTLSVSPIFFNPLGFAFAIMSGMSMGFLLSPFSGLILLLSSISGQSPYKVGLRYNLSFAIFFYGLAVTAIALANWIA